MDRSLRRFYNKRWKERIKRRLLIYRWSSSTPRNIGVMANSRKLCSSYCCGSRRKYGKDKIEKMQLREYNDYLDYLSQLEEL